MNITTTSLPGGVKGAAYSATLAATGGTKPYKWRVSTGKLPKGLKLAGSGKISGTPTKVGDSSITVEVTDKNKINTSKIYTVDIT